MLKPKSRLRAIKALHTLVWAVFAGAILAIPVCAFTGHLKVAWGLIGLVFIEVMVLVANGMKCPLTGIAARYTEERQDNFDIYLPLWLARHNQLVFGGLYVAGMIYALLLSVVTH